ncbi:hypothetical protein [Chitinophaga sp.]|uniref:hypothetical protein n=1 Tax=Chitinophaga sp. TaxID=1869181 RepID=UPI0031D8D1DD
MKIHSLICLLVLHCLLITSVKATYITVRLIKDKSSRCTQPAVLNLQNKPSAYTISTKKWYNGENEREIFFVLETTDCHLPSEYITIEAQGVTIQRAIIGRTDVPFTHTDNQYRLALINDTTDGMHIQTPYQSPKGGPFVWIYHNWKERLNGDYLKASYPGKGLAAALNYEIACQEMLRLMGCMSGLHQTFKGEFILLNCESSAPRAHLDYPPHWHLQHWEHGYNAEFGIDWRKEQYIIPHYYLDSVGNIIRNQQSVHQQYHVKEGIKSEFLPGDTAAWNDLEGNPIFKQVITSGGLTFILPNGELWQLLPGKLGASQSVSIYKTGSFQAEVTVEDNNAAGKVSIAIVYSNYKVWQNVINYDPFTGVMQKVSER